MIATRRFLTKFRSAAAVMLAVLAVVFVPRLAHAQGSPQGAGPRPTVVLVHGAWADASSWDGVIPLLQHDGLTVVAPP